MYLIKCVINEIKLMLDFKEITLYTSTLKAVFKNFFWEGSKTCIL
jgi:hypothetical protein